jgi:thymidylate kinase
MLILLEGPDGGGKTTLANNLALAIDNVPPQSVEIRHCGQPRLGPLDEYIRPLYNYIPGVGQHIIYDRHYLGELIYGPLYRGQSNIAADLKVIIERFLNQHGALLVHVTQDVATLVERCKDKNEDFLQEGDIYFVRQQFIEEVAESRIKFKVAVIDATNEDASDIIWLARKLEERVHDRYS